MRIRISCLVALILASCQSPLPLHSSPPSSDISTHRLQPAQPQPASVQPVAKAVTITGKIVLPDSFSTQALSNAQLLKQATVSIVDIASKSVRNTTISDTTGQFTFPAQTLADGYYFIDVQKRENSTIGNQALFLRTLLQLINGAVQTATGTNLVISPHTTALSMAALLGQVNDYSTLLSKVSTDGLTLNGDISTDIPVAKVNQVLTKLNTTLTGQGDPLKDWYVLGTSLSKNTALRDDEVELNGLGFNANTTVTLGGQAVDILERSGVKLKVKIPTGGDTGNLVASQGGNSTQPLPIKIATQVKIISGNNQLALQNNNLPQPMVFEAQDVNNQAVPDIPLKLQLTQGSGTLPTTVTTDANGRASVNMQVTSTGYQDVAVSFPNASSPPAQNLRQIGVGAYGQRLFFVQVPPVTGEARSQYNTPMIVKTVQNDGTPWPGITVNFRNTINTFQFFNSIPPASSNENAPSYVTSAVSDANGIAKLNMFYFPQSACTPGSCPKFTADLGSYGDVITSAEVAVTAPSAGRLVDHINIVQGNNQAVEGGRDLPAILEAQAIGVDGQPVPNVNLRFSFSQGTGIMKYFVSGMGANQGSGPITLRTSASGKAYIRMIAPPTAQTVKIKVESVLGEGTPVEFVENIIISSTNLLVPISPFVAFFLDAGTSTDGTAAKPHLVAKVLDPNGNPVVNQTVNFAVQSGCMGSGFTPSSALTDINGIATSVFTAQTNLAGCYGTVVRMSAPGVFGTFDAPPIYARTQLTDNIQKFSGDNQTGTLGIPLALPFRVTSHDQFGNRTSGPAGLKVRFTNVVANTGYFDASLGSNSIDITIPGASQPITSVNYTPTTTGPIQVSATLLGGSGNTVVFNLNVP